jgi:hypothetical protein
MSNTDISKQFWMELEKNLLQLKYNFDGHTIKKYVGCKL